MNVTFISVIIHDTYIIYEVTMSTLVFLQLLHIEIYMRMHFRYIFFHIRVIQNKSRTVLTEKQ